jgi:hypothetical protein
MRKVFETAKYGFQSSLSCPCLGDFLYCESFSDPDTVDKGQNTLNTCRRFYFFSVKTFSYAIRPGEMSFELKEKYDIL